MDIGKKKSLAPKTRTGHYITRMTIRTSTARRERVRERARRDILESAARVFAPSLYRYFGSKEEIFDSLLALVSAEVQEAFDAPVDRGLPLPDRLSTLFVALHHLAEGRRETLDLLTAHADFGQRQAHIEGLLQAWLQKYVGRAELRVPPALAARVAAGILLALNHGRNRTGMTPGEMARAAADLILHGVSA
jgi:AcrR family transcriptional regulator